jgi:hypothetical protein
MDEIGLTAYLARYKTSEQGTIGKFVARDFSCFSLELPWRENKRSISCIPPGEYKTIITNSNKYGTIYWVTSVPNRSGILIHWGNYAGDSNEGFKTHSMGCILLGKSIGLLGGQRAILNSRVTVTQFMSYMQRQPFVLKIYNEL